jgi:hypothetical protein
MMTGFAQIYLGAGQAGGGDVGGMPVQGCPGPVIPHPVLTRQRPPPTESAGRRARQNSWGSYCRLRRLRRRVHVRANTRARLSEARTTIVTSTAGTQRTWSPFTT